MKQIFFFALWGIAVNAINAQSNFTQSHKEIEYQFGTIDDKDLSKISEIEKIKYEFKQIERTVTQTIDEQFALNMDIQIISNSCDQPWMKLAKRFKYTTSNMLLYDEYGKVMKTLSYSEDELKNNKLISEDIRQNGYHPGLVVFPKFSDELVQQLLSQGIQVEKNTRENTFKIKYEDGSSENYNEEN